MVATVNLAGAASDLSCPNGSKGKHPKCICDNDLPYDEINHICAISINVKLAKCPKGTGGSMRLLHCPT